MKGKKIIDWVLLLLSVFFIFAMCYYMAYNIKGHHWFMLVVDFVGLWVWSLNLRTAIRSLCRGGQAGRHPWD